MSEITYYERESWDDADYPVEGYVQSDEEFEAEYRQYFNNLPLRRRLFITLYERLERYLCRKVFEIHKGKSKKTLLFRAASKFEFHVMRRFR